MRFFVGGVLQSFWKIKMFFEGGGGGCWLNWVIAVEGGGLKNILWCDSGRMKDG